MISMPCGYTPCRPTFSWKAAAAARLQFTSRSNSAVTINAVLSAGTCGFMTSGEYALAASASQPAKLPIDEKDWKAHALALLTEQKPNIHSKLRHGHARQRCVRQPARRNARH